MLKPMADAVLYAETLRALSVEDPLGGETEADKQLRASSAKWERSRLALKEISTKDWGRTPVSPQKKRKVNRSG